MLAAAMEQHKTKEWSKLLPMLQFNMNTSKSSSTKSVPFEIFFNKKPNFLIESNFHDLIENPSTSTASTSSEEVDKEVEAEEEDVEENELAIEIEKKRTLLNENKKIKEYLTTV